MTRRAVLGPIGAVISPPRYCYPVTHPNLPIITSITSLLCVLLHFLFAGGLYCNYVMYYTITAHYKLQRKGKIMATKITKELVFDLADQLSAQGIEPTNLKIREMNDNHGSLSSITPHLKAWKEQRAAEAVEALPDMPEERLIAALRPVWGELVREAQALYKEEREAVQREKVAIQEENDGYMSEIDRQESKIEDLERRVAELSEEARELQAVRVELSGMIHRNELLEKNLEDLKEGKQIAEQARDKAVTALEASQQREEELKTQLGQAKLDHKEMSDKFDEATRKLADVNVLRSQELDKLNSANDRVVELERTNAALDAKLNAAEKQTEKAEAQSASAEARVLEANQKAEELDRANATLSAQLEASNDKVETMAQQVAKAEERAEEVSARFLDMAGTWQQKLAALESGNEEDQATIFDALKDDEESTK
jgi:DNA repair exonuclease SbcCD ATPase subunit